MSITVDAVYEDGVLKPIQGLPLKESTKVRIAIELESDLEGDTVLRRPYGLCAGEFTVPQDFDQPLPEDVLRDFEGR
jgi:predicted DNA-binding antitoxin AbrB/MazE fold protein